MPVYVAAVLVVVLDQLTKALIQGTVGSAEGLYVRVAGDLLWFRVVYNSGMAFGLMQNSSFLFALAALALVAGMLFYSRRLALAPSVVRLALGLVLGGAVGNLVDRARYGYVFDFVDVRLWPYVFNVADASITSGVLLLLAYMLLGGGQGPSVRRPEESAAAE